VVDLDITSMSVQNITDIKIINTINIQNQGGQGIKTQRKVHAKIHSNIKNVTIS
jgi:hypothetical protein